jgi:hypothetical protein
VSEDRRRVCGSEIQIFTVSLSGANSLPTPNQFSPLTEDATINEQAEQDPYQQTDTQAA